MLAAPLMDLGLRDRICIVTGSTGGIGLATARLLAEEGARVAISARREHLLEEVAQQIKAAGHIEPVVLAADLYEPETPVRLAQAARERLGRIDILINAAGGSRPTTFDAPRELWEEAMMFNFMRLRELTHAVVAGMKEHSWGRVVNLTGTSEPYNINANDQVYNQVFPYSATPHAGPTNRKDP